jgi:O-antigen ligase
VVESGNDSDINAIGLAYTNSIVFFILYYFLIYYQLKKWVRGMVILSMCSTIFLIFSTQSRGALIYIALILLINNFYRLKSMKNIMKFLAYFIVFVLLATVFYFEVIKSMPSLENKVDGAIDRFSLLSKVGAGTDVKVDQSAYQRTLFIKQFFDNLSDIILFGQDNYKPYPHNQFLEIIMRWGIFFGMPLLFVSISSFFRSVKILMKGKKINPFINMAILLFAFAFLQSLSSMSLDVNRILWFGLGFIIGLPSIYRLTRRKVISR